MQDTSGLILAELRELRRDYNNHARETGERLSALESQMRALMGNGQPGRISNIESAIETLKTWRWKVIGAAIGGSGVISALCWVIAQVIR